MRYRPLGRTGIVVSEFCLGAGDRASGSAQVVVARHSLTLATIGAGSSPAADGLDGSRGARPLWCGRLTDVRLPDVSYARSGDTAIAYQVIGDGHPDIVFARGVTGDLVSTWDQPLLVRHVEGIAACGRLLMFFAATYPDRCAGLVLFDPRVKGRRAPDYPWAPRVSRSRSEPESRDSQLRARCLSRARSRISSQVPGCSSRIAASTR
jgi:hypothetical protein